MNRREGRKINNSVVKADLYKVRESLIKQIKREKSKNLWCKIRALFTATKAERMLLKLDEIITPKI